MSANAKNERQRTTNNDEENENPLKCRPSIVPQDVIIKEIRSCRQFELLYMEYAVQKDNIYFHPYYLKTVKHPHINWENYMTMTQCGVTHFTNEMIFIKLDKWEQDYKIFCQVTNIKLFKMFRMWKAFFVWHKTIRYNKLVKSMEKLEKLLFCEDPVLIKALLQIQDLRYEMEFVSFADVTANNDVAFFYFVEDQVIKFEYVKSRVYDYRTQVVEIVLNSCHASLLLKGFTYDDSNFEPLRIKRGKTIGGMTYPEKANKRKFCERLACFVKLADYMTNYTLYWLTQRSYSDIATLYRGHLAFLSGETLARLEEGTSLEQLIEVTPRQANIFKWPLYQIDLYIDTKGDLQLVPSQTVVSSYMETITNYWDETIRSFHNFLNEPALQIFVQPTIMGKQVEWSAGTAPSLYFLMNQDVDMLDDIQCSSEAISIGYDYLWKFLERFQYFVENFKIGISMDPVEMHMITDLDILRRMCDDFLTQMKILESVLAYQPLGLFFLCLEPFKELYLPLPKKLFNILCESTPAIGNVIIDEILTGCTEIMERLENVPKPGSLLDLYESWLDTANTKIQGLEERMEYLRELYDMMGEFGIPIPPEDLQEYLGLSMVLGKVRNFCDNRMEIRNRNVE